MEKVAIPAHLKRVAILPCERFVLKNRNDPELSGANFQATLCHLKQLLKNFHFFTDEQIFTVTRRRTRRINDCMRISVNQEEIRRDKTPAHTISGQSLVASVAE